MLWPFNHFRKPHAPQRGTIGAIYGMIVAQAREPLFYRAMGVPDTVNGLTLGRFFRSQRARRNSFCRQALPQVCESRRRCVNISPQTTQATVASCANNRRYQRCFFYRAGFSSSQRFRSRHITSVMEHLISHFCLS
jgi:hypothetical protein